MHEKSTDDSSPSAARKYVLDSFAIIAYLDDEEGAGTVDDLFRRAPQEIRLFLSIINLGEIAYSTERERGEETLTKTLENIRRLPIVFVGVDEKTVLAAAHIKAKHAVSYADAFAIALAQELNATIVTGDPEFQSVEKIVDILWLRQVTPKEKPAKKPEARERRATYRVKPRRQRA